MLGAQDETRGERPWPGLVRLGTGVVAVVPPVGPSGVPELLEVVERLPGQVGSGIDQPEGDRQRLAGVGQQATRRLGGGRRVGMKS